MCCYTDIADTTLEYPYSAFILCLLVLFYIYEQLVTRRPKKQLTPEAVTNVLITGGVQGLGKKLAEIFVKETTVGSINLIVIDVNEALAPKLLEDLKASSRSDTFKRVFFYKANLANPTSTEDVWRQVTRKHGPVHILVNNHARCTGKTFAEMTANDFNLTMDINFSSYVHLSKLFLS